MRADTEGKDMGKRFATVIGMAAACVMALGAQTAAAEPVDTSPQLASTVTAPSSDPIKEVVVLRPTRKVRVPDQSSDPIKEVVVLRPTR
jgi:hypothetical protein